MNITKPTINNAFYDQLGDRWYDDESHPIALLRAESTIKLQFVQESLRKEKISDHAKILDIGCGAGLISNPLGALGYRVKGIDMSAGSLAIARQHRPPQATVEYEVADAYALPDADAQYDAVIMLDFLEHVDQPGRAIAEASRVLKPGGILVYHTFNRTWLSFLLVIKAVEFFSNDCPEHMHLYRMFITPRELAKMCVNANLQPQFVTGIRPSWESKAFWLSLSQRRVHPDFSFRFTKLTAVGYIGYAMRQ